MHWTFSRELCSAVFSRNWCQNAKRLNFFYQIPKSMLFHILYKGPTTISLSSSNFSDFLALALADFWCELYDRLWPAKTFLGFDSFVKYQKLLPQRRVCDSIGELKWLNFATLDQLTNLSCNQAFKLQFLQLQHRLL